MNLFQFLFTDRADLPNTNFNAAPWLAVAIASLRPHHLLLVGRAAQIALDQGPHGLEAMDPRSALWLTTIANLGPGRTDRHCYARLRYLIFLVAHLDRDVGRLGSCDCHLLAGVFCAFVSRPDSRL